MDGERTLFLLGLVTKMLGQTDLAGTLVDRARQPGRRAGGWDANEVGELLGGGGIPCLAFEIVPGYPPDELQAVADGGLVVLCELRAAEEGGDNRWGVLEISDGTSQRVVVLHDDTLYPYQERVGADDFTGQYVMLLLEQPNIAANRLRAEGGGGAKK